MQQPWLAVTHHTHTDLLQVHSGPVSEAQNSDDSFSLGHTCGEFCSDLCNTSVRHGLTDECKITTIADFGQQGIGDAFGKASLDEELLDPG